MKLMGSGVVVYPHGIGSYINHCVFCILVGVYNFAYSGTNIGSSFTAGQLTQLQQASFDLNVFNPVDLPARNWPHFNFKFYLSLNQDPDFEDVVEVRIQIYEW